MVSSTVVSCPGKVLLAGGYLVLSPLHQGFVVATPSRFYTVVRERADQSGNAGDAFDIDVRSPQFVGGSWRYRATKKDGEWVVDAADR
jgi:phosphomevalonate kinase